MKKITLFAISILLLFYIKLTYSDLNNATFDWNQPDYCSTLAKSDATKYDFYKCAYFEKIRQTNEIKLPTQAELEAKRLKEYEEREDKRNKEIIEEENKKIESEWQSRIDKNITEYYKISKANELVNQWIDLVKKSLCVNTEECINAVYLYKESLSLNYREDIYDNLDNVYLLLATQYNKKNQFNNAIKYALLSKDIESINEILIISYNWLALEYKNNEEYEKAIEYGLLSIKKMNTNYNSNTWLIYSIIWESYFELKKYNEAIYYFNKVLEYRYDDDMKKIMWNYIKYSEQELVKENELIESILTWSCWQNSIENNDWNCICKDWYVWEFSDDLNNLNCKKEEKIVIEEPKNDKQCQDKNWINSYFNNKWYCLCKEWFEFSESSWYTICEEKESLVLRKQIDKKVLVKLDKTMPKLLLKSEDTLILLRNHIDVLLKKNIDKKTKDILLYIKLIINEKLFDSIDFDALLN